MVHDSDEGAVLCRSVDSVLQMKFAGNFCSLSSHTFHFALGDIF